MHVPLCENPFRDVLYDDLGYDDTSAINSGGLQLCLSSQEILYHQKIESVVCCGMTVMLQVEEVESVEHEVVQDIKIMN